MSASSDGARVPPRFRGISVLVPHLTFWSGLALFIALFVRHLRGTARAEEFLTPSLLVFPLHLAFTSYAGVTLPAAILLAATLVLGVRGLRRPGRARGSRLRRVSFLCGSGAILAIVAGMLLEGVLQANPNLLGPGLHQLPDRGRYLFDAEHPGPTMRFDTTRYGFRFRPHLEQHYEMLRDDLLLRGLVPGVQRIEEPRLVSFRTDEHGFRLPNPTGDERPLIVAVGDNLTMASELEEHRIWPRILGRLLDREVLNLGVDGYCPTQSVRVLEEFGLPRRPAVAILMLFAGDDLDEEARFARFLGREAPLQRIPTRREPRYRYSLLRALLDPRRDRKPYLRGLWRGPPEAFPVELPDRPDALNPIELQIADRRLGFAVCPEHLERLALSGKAWKAHPGWLPLTRALGRFHSLCEARGIHPLVVLVPTKPEVVLPRLLEPPYRAKLVGHFKALERRVGTAEEAIRAIAENRRALARALEGHCEGLGLAFLDYAPLLEKRLSQGRLHYLPFSSRLSSPGHTVLARTLSLELEKRGWIENH